MKSVHGYRIALVVESVFAPAQPGVDPRHARSLEHRLRVSVREDATGRAVQACLENESALFTLDRDFSSIARHTNLKLL